MRGSEKAIGMGGLVISQRVYYDDFNLKRISELLVYAPSIAIEEMITMLERYQELYTEIRNH